MEFFAALDLGVLAKIIMIDIMLGGDNAIVIAMACAALPPEIRKKAIIYGTLGAIAFRGILLTGVGQIFETYEWLKIIAGFWLLVIGVQLLTSHNEEHSVSAQPTMWGAMKTIIVADAIMSIDNVVAITSAAEGAGEYATYYAVGGVLLSIPIIVWGSNFLIGAMKKFPAIVWFGAGLLGWIGVETALHTRVAELWLGSDYNHFLAGCGAVAVLAVAAIINNSNSNNAKPA